MKEYIVIKPILHGGKIYKEGDKIKNLTSEQEKRMLERELIEEYKEDEVEEEIIDTDKQDPEDVLEKDTAEAAGEEIQEIKEYTENELKSFDKVKLLEIAGELELKVSNNIGTEKLITKIMAEYEEIKKESQEKENGNDKEE